MTDELSRIARLEQKLADLDQSNKEQFRDVDRRLDKNDEVHEKLLQMVSSVSVVIERFGWITKGMLLVLVGLGMIGGWFLEKWHMLMGWLAK